MFEGAQYIQAGLYKNAFILLPTLLAHYEVFSPQLDNKTVSLSGFHEIGSLKHVWQEKEAENWIFTKKFIHLQQNNQK